MRSYANYTHVRNYSYRLRASRVRIDFDTRLINNRYFSILSRNRPDKITWKRSISWWLTLNFQSLHTRSSYICTLIWKIRKISRARRAYRSSGWNFLSATTARRRRQTAKYSPLGYGATDPSVFSALDHTTVIKGTHLSGWMGRKEVNLGARR